MKNKITLFLGLLLLTVAVSPIQADEHPENNIAKHCREALDTFCSNVTPGKGRILSCLYAYSDQVPDQCREAVMDVTEQVKLIKAAASHLESECRDDIQRFCKGVKPGDGRIMICLEKHDSQLSKVCKTALKDVGLRD